MDYSSMADAYIVSNHGWSLLVGTVHNGSILNIDPISHFDAMYIATNNGLEPKATVITTDHIADDGSIFSQKTVFAKLGRFAEQGLY